MPGHDAERDDRSLMPLLDFAQNRFEIFADRQPAFACNRDRRRRDAVAEFSPRAWLSSRLEIDDHIALTARILICTQMNIHE